MKSKTERLEVRMDEGLAFAIDTWRDRYSPGATRGHVVRSLIELGMKTTIGKFTEGEKVILAFLNDIYGNLNLGGNTKLDAIVDGFRNGHPWVSDLEMADLFVDPKSSRITADTVLETLKMWEIIERSVEDFTDKERAELLEPTALELYGMNSGGESTIRLTTFQGFDAKTESSLIAVAEFLIKHGNLKHFSARNLTSSNVGPTQYIDKQRVNAYKKMRSVLDERLLSPKEVKHLLVGCLPINPEVLGPYLKNMGL